jgi:hypothetical protein
MTDEASYELVPGPPDVESYVSLLADGTAHRLYERFEFRLTAPDSVGMLLQL